MSCNTDRPEEENLIVGVVICGGKSTRMGEDKGLKKSGNKTWSENISGLFEKLSLPSVISINESQEKEYKSIYRDDLLVKDHIAIEGPLNGLFSVHDQYPHNDLLLVPCDMQKLNTELLKVLLNTYEQYSGAHDFFVFQNKDVIEPFPGIYTSEGLKKAFGLHLSGQLEKKSMKYLLEIGNTFFISADEYLQKLLVNYNTQEDIQ